MGDLRKANEALHYITRTKLKNLLALNKDRKKVRILKSNKAWVGMKVIDLIIKQYK